MSFRHVTSGSFSWPLGCLLETKSYGSLSVKLWDPIASSVCFSWRSPWQISQPQWSKSSLCLGLGTGDNTNWTPTFVVFDVLECRREEGQEAVNHGNWRNIDEHVIGENTAMSATLDVYSGSWGVNVIAGRWLMSHSKAWLSFLMIIFCPRRWQCIRHSKIV